jgi:hypothetical protein
MIHDHCIVTFKIYFAVVFIYVYICDLLIFMASTKLTEKNEYALEIEVGLQHIFISKNLNFLLF